MIFKLVFYLCLIVSLIDTESINNQFIDTEHVLIPNKYEQDENLNTSEDGVKISYINFIKNPSKYKSNGRVCTDLSPVKEFFLSNIEPFIEHFVSILPEEYQFILLEETRFARLNIASCSLVALVCFMFTSTWFFIANSIENKKLKINLNFQNEIISLNLKLKEIKLENELLSNEAFEIENQLNQKENQIKDLIEKNSGLDSLKQNEKVLKLEIENLKKNIKDYESNSELMGNNLKESEVKLNSINLTLNELKVQLENQKSIEIQLNEEIESLKIRLKNQISITPESIISDKINELKNENSSLQMRLDQYRLDNEKYFGLLTEKETQSKNLELKLNDNERLIREHEMQIKILNDLRDKDTKQHIKALAELDMKLKQKSSESEKVSHLYEQLRIKQERIQDLEIQLARAEKQSTQERQTFEKQAHENWLNAKKFEKELKETRNELGNLKEKFNELNTETNQLRQENLNLSGYYNLQNSLVEQDEGKVDQPLQIDTNQQLEISRPSSATSSSSGINSGIGGPHLPPMGFVRAPFRYPFPPVYAMSSPNPDLVYGPRLPFNYALQQNAHMMYKMMMQSRSANSSQLPSPGANMFPTSTSFPNQNVLNESLTNGGFPLNNHRSDIIDDKVIESNTIQSTHNLEV